MNIAVLRESGAGEARVALMPDSVQKLVALKSSVSIESSAGMGAARTDDDYATAGANVIEDRRRNHHYGAGARPARACLNGRTRCPGDEARFDCDRSGRGDRGQRYRQQ